MEYFAVESWRVHAKYYPLDTPFFLTITPYVVHLNFFFSSLYSLNKFSISLCRVFLIFTDIDLRSHTKAWHWACIHKCGTKFI